MDHNAYGVEVPPCSVIDLRKAAEEVRKMIGFDDFKPFPVVQFIERILPRLYDGFLFEVLPKREMGNEHGRTFPDKHIIQLREDVYDALCNDEGQARFTGAHECSHQIFHEGTGRTRQGFLYGYEEMLKRIEPNEVWCYCNPLSEMADTVTRIIPYEAKGMKKSRKVDPAQLSIFSFIGKEVADEHTGRSIRRAS